MTFFYLSKPLLIARITSHTAGSTGKPEFGVFFAGTQRLLAGIAHFASRFRRLAVVQRRDDPFSNLFRARSRSERLRDSW